MPAWFNEVPLLQVTPDLKKFLRDLVPAAAIIPHHITAPWARWWNNSEERQPEFPGLEINRLWMPTGASRYGIFYGLADAATVNDLRDACYGDGAGSEGVTQVPYELVLDSEPGHGSLDTAVIYDMYMLPPRPLSFPGLPRSLWLVILVDERYYWWKTDTGNWGTDARSSWDDVIESCRAALGKSASDWECDPVHADYLGPDDFIAKASYQPIPIVLEAALWSINRRLVLHPKLATGGANKVAIQTYQQAADEREAALVGRKVVSGGTLYVRKDPSTYTDAGGLIPWRMRMVFPEAADRDGRFEVTQEVSQIAGFESYLNTMGTVTFQNTFEHDGVSGPYLTLAYKFFADWLNWTAEEYDDVTLAGIVNMNLSGYYDAVEWIDNLDYDDTFSSDPQTGYVRKAEKVAPRSFTRIYRPAYDSRPITLHHANGAGSGSDSSDDTIQGICQDGSTYTITFIGDTVQVTRP